MKRHIIIFSTAIAFTVFTSCDAMLDREPETSRTEASTFENPEDFRLAVNYFYNWLPSLFDDQVGIIQRDLDADIATQASSRMSDISDSSYGTSTTDSRYSSYFTRIRAINQVFANQDRVQDISLISRYLAEACFFRAYFSFLMFVDYGPLTIVKGVTDVDSPELYAARASRDDFADFIIEDLKTALEMDSLPNELEIRGTSEEGRITVGAVNALLSRVCLFEATWQKYHEGNMSRAESLFETAVEASQAVMSDASYELFRTEEMGDESYMYMFILENKAKTNKWNIDKSRNTEYILKKCFSDDAEGNYKYVSSAKTPGDIVASRKMFEMHLDAAGTAAVYDYKSSYTSFLENKDPRACMNFRAPNSYIWDYSSGRVDWNGTQADNANLKLKAATDQGYPNRKWVTERSLDPDCWGIDVPIIRLGEIYLNYAEALFELNGYITDAELDNSVNLLRKRVGMPGLSNGNLPEGSNMLNEIRRERTVELYLEGFRLTDLKRWATAEDEMSDSFEYIYMGEDSAFLNIRTDNGCNIGMPPAEQLSEDGYAVKEDASRRQFMERHYLRPLPTDQLKLNRNLIQNPGW